MDSFSQFRMTAKGEELIFSPRADSSENNGLLNEGINSETSVKVSLETAEILTNRIRHVRIAAVLRER